MQNLLTVETDSFLMRDALEDDLDLFRLLVLSVHATCCAVGQVLTCISYSDAWPTALRNFIQGRNAEDAMQPNETTRCALVSPASSVRYSRTWSSTTASIGSSRPWTTPTPQMLAISL